MASFQSDSSIKQDLSRTNLLFRESIQKEEKSIKSRSKSSKTKIKSTKELSDKIKWTATKVGLSALTIIFVILAFVLSVASLGGLPYAISNVRRRIVQQPSLQNASNKMKQEEETAKLNALRQVLGESEEVLGTRIQGFQDILANKESLEPGAVNRRFIHHLRSALRSNVYIRLKQNAPDDPYVCLLQKFALTLYQGVYALPAYQALGQAIINDKQKKDKEVTGKLSYGQSAAQMLKASHEQATKKLFTDHGVIEKIAYALNHPAQVIGSAASEGGWKAELAGLFGGEVAEKYDSHGMLANNPSLQGTTTWQQGESQVTVNNVYGGSPTIGNDEIGPEFEACLEAVEANRNRRPPDPNIPHQIIYTNFQNINSGAEGARSRTIMRLAQRFPNCFRAITLPKDSDFYKGGKAWEGIGDIQDFGNRMRSHMLDRDSFTTENRTTTQRGQGFYFSGNVARWSETIDAIISNANDYFSPLENALANPTPTEVRRLRMAYQEYVYSMVQSAFEAQVAQDLIDQGVNDPSIMAIRACKENIDRGGAENTKYMYTRYANTRGSNRTVTNSLLTGVFHSRALSARNRVILEHRIGPLLDFMHHVDPDQFRNQQVSVMSQLGFGALNQRYTPALSAPG